MQLEENSPVMEAGDVRSILYPFFVAVFDCGAVFCVFFFYTRAEALLFWYVLDELVKKPRFGSTVRTFLDCRQLTARLDILIYSVLGEGSVAAFLPTLPDCTPHRQSYNQDQSKSRWRQDQDS